MPLRCLIDGSYYDKMQCYFDPSPRSVAMDEDATEMKRKRPFEGAW